MPLLEKFYKIIHEKLPEREMILGQFIRYFFTGGVAFIVDFSLFSLFLYGFEWHYLLANLMGLLGGLVVNYLISISWVFSACKRTLNQKKGLEFLLFCLIGFIGVGLNQLLMYLMVGHLVMNAMIAKIMAAAIVLLWNFGARKILLFKTKKEIG